MPSLGHAARVAATMATALGAGALVTAGLIRSGRQTAPVGGLPPGWWWALTLATGLCLVTAAWLGAAQNPRASLSCSLALACWVLPVAAGFPTTPAWAKAVVLALPPLLVGAVTQLGSGAWPLPSTRRLWLLRGAWGGAIGSSGVLLLAYDPFGDPSCLRTCLSINAPLIRATTTRDAMLVTGALTIAATVSGLGSLSPMAAPGRPTAGLARASLVSLTLVGSAIGWLHLAPSAVDRRTVEAAITLALFLAGVAVVGREVLLRARRMRVEGVLAQLAAGETMAGLEFAVGTPRQWVDPNGVPSDVPPDSALPTLGDEQGPIVRWVAGNAPDRAPEELIGSLHPATRLGLANARLAASVKAQTHELGASQARIVEAADAERLRLSRDLHDRTQQRLVGAVLHLRLASTSARSGTGTSLLLEAEERLRPVLAALRTVAHGPFPEVLAEEGLAAALEEWSADSGATVACSTTLPLLPSATARAAFAAVTSPALDPAEPITVAVRDGELLITGRLRAGSEAVDVSASDRVGAAGGRVLVVAHGTPPRQLEVRLPCAS
jgi:signal transduction histidine kinase